MRVAKHKKAHKPEIHRRIRSHLRLAFIPHKSNQYRPHLVRRYGLLAIAAIVAATQLSYNLIQTGSVLGQTSTVSVAELLVDTNEERTKENLSSLRMSPQLTRAAGLKAQDMYDKQYWAHNSPDGKKPWHWFQATGYTYSAAGENLARNFSNSQATITAWMDSAEHRSNILNNQYTEVGFAVVQGSLNDEPTTLVVALYGTPARSEVAGVTSSIAAATQTPSALLAPVSRFGVALQSLTPAAIASLVLLMSALIVALIAHSYRNKLPKQLRRSWYLHHGLIKANSLAVLMIVTVWLYSGGQI